MSVPFTRFVVAFSASLAPSQANSATMVTITSVVFILTDIISVLLLTDWPDDDSTLKLVFVYYTRWLAIGGEQRTDPTVCFVTEERIIR